MNIQKKKNKRFHIGDYYVDFVHITFMKIKCLEVWTANHFKCSESKLLFDIRISVRKFSTIGDEINVVCVLKGG